MGGKKRVMHRHEPTSIAIQKEFKTKPDTTTETSDKTHYKIEHHRKYTPHWLKLLLKIEHDFPPGLLMLFVFSSLMLCMYIIMTVLFSFTMVFGMIIEGPLARLLNIGIIIMISFMLFGFAKKKLWGYHLAHIVFFFVIINSFVSMFFIKKSVSGILTVFVSFSFFFILMMNFITLWYIRSKKNYFIHNYHESHMSREDKTYIYSITLLWLVFFFTSWIFGNAYYTETLNTAEILIGELQSVYPYDAEDYCLSKTDTKDVCLLTASLMYEKELNTMRLCKDMDSQFYRYICYKSINENIP